MHSLIYRFITKPGTEQEFKIAWSAVTQYLLAEKKSCGSRLHTTQHENEFIAYAQWPSKEIFDSAIKGERPIEIINSRMQMRECCEVIETLFEMEVVADFLK